MRGSTCATRATARGRTAVRPGAVARVGGCGLPARRSCLGRAPTGRRRRYARAEAPTAGGCDPVEGTGCPGRRRIGRIGKLCAGIHFSVPRRAVRAGAVPCSRAPPPAHAALLGAPWRTAACDMRVLPRGASRAPARALCSADCAANASRTHRLTRRCTLRRTPEPPLPGPRPPPPLRGASSRANGGAGVQSGGAGRGQGGRQYARPKYVCSEERHASSFSGSASRAPPQALLRALERHAARRAHPPPLIIAIC